MRALFKELPSFERVRSDYLDDDGFRDLQNLLIKNPQAGAVIGSTGGLSKLCLPDPGRHKGKRGGLRVIYYWWLQDQQFWLFTLFDKDEAADLTAQEKNLLKQLLLRELEERH
jgi:hypothetical protein